MGTYLATGIVQEIAIPKKHIPHKDITIDNIVNSLRNEINLSFYTFSEDQEGYIWQIQPKVLETNLTDFLALQGQMYCEEGNSYMHIEDTISKIKQATTGENIIELASSKGLYNFQLVDSIIKYITVG
jgi:hypothetical protein